MADTPKGTVVQNVPVGEKTLNFEDEDRMIRQVNAHYNNAIKYKNEARNDGKPGGGGWQLYNLADGGEGDCDTYARTKGEALVRNGFSPEKLAIVTARLWNGVDHAMLRVDRGEGKYVYLTNPQNTLQKSHPDASVLDELPGKPVGMNISYPMWAPMEQAYAERRKKKSQEEPSS